MKSASPNQPQAPAPSRDAGRALDALVAEKVMGYRWRTVSGIGPLLETPRGIPAAFRHDDGELRDSSELPHYSTDIAAAWLVVENLAALGMLVVVRTRAAISGLPRVEVTGVHRDRRNEWLVHNDGDTIPLAICRAALLAVEAAS